MISASATHNNDCRYLVFETESNGLAVWTVIVADAGGSILCSKRNMLVGSLVTTFDSALLKTRSAKNANAWHVSVTARASA